MTVQAYLEDSWKEMGHFFDEFNSSEEETEKLATRNLKMEYPVLKWVSAEC